MQLFTGENVLQDEKAATLTTHMKTTHLRVYLC